jgi:predicted nucleic acid-binding protein
LTDRFVFDAGPLLAFARVRRLDLLEARYAGRALWTVEVRDEIQRALASIPPLGGILRADWLGEPVRMTDPADLVEIERLRRALGGTAEQPLRHLGEAATLVLARREGATAVLDDRDARRLAHALGVPLTGTLGILRACARAGLLSPEEAWAIVEQMKSTGARFPPDVGPQWFV